MRSDQGSAFSSGYRSREIDLDERGFARAVGAENGDVLALRDGERDAIEHHAVAALDGDILEIEKGDQSLIVIGRPAKRARLSAVDLLRKLARVGRF